jgi:hypothetical protein
MKKHSVLICLSLVLAMQSTLFSFNISEAQMRQYYIGKLLGFSTTKTCNEVYFFTNWTSDPCRNLDPAIKAMMPELLKQATVFFISPETDEMQAINTANRICLLNPEKPLGEYLQIREALYTLAQKSAKPTEDDVKKALLPLGIKYELPQNPKGKETVDIASSVCTRLISNFKLKETPAVVVYNLTHSKQKTLTGAAAITQAAVLAALAEVNIPPPADPADESKKEEAKDSTQATSVTTTA